MSNRTRALFYLGLNVLVSACTAWLVLTLWGRSHLPPPPPTPEVAVATVQPLATASPTPPRFAYTVRSGDTLGSIAQKFGVSIEALCELNHLKPDTTLAVGQALLIPGVAPTPTPVALSQGDLTIDGVLGAGVLEDERVLISYHGQGSLNLQGWKLDDGEGHVYTFPVLSLEQNGAVQVWTKGGLPDTVVDLYWGLDKAVWRSGKIVSLRNPQGQVVAQYVVP
ncbi:MAG: LysM peptidoglycan-binding domain-containing protein [Chloroflexi bacterium]|nr:LysM peptidoglycan-binding domain-containing protein [Chloroflexota bacterium]